MTFFDDPRIKMSDQWATTTLEQMRLNRGLLAGAADLRYKVCNEVPPEQPKTKSTLALDVIALYVRAREYDKAREIAREYAGSNMFTQAAHAIFFRDAVSTDDELKTYYPEW